MPRIELDAVAPDFNLPDFTGKAHRLADYRSVKNILLVFNRGFQ